MSSTPTKPEIPQPTPQTGQSSATATQPSQRQVVPTRAASDATEAQAKEFYEMQLSLRQSYTQEVDSKLERLDQMIGEAHAPSVGTYKEHVIREQIEAIVPQKFSVNTGFVLTNRGGKITRSCQIDILIWDSTNFAPLIRAGDFVVIQPEALRGAIEVKGNLTHEEIKDAFANLESLTQFIDDMMTIHPLHSSGRFPFVRYLVAGDVNEGKTKTGKDKTKVIFPDTIWNKLRATYTDEEVGRRLSWCGHWADYAAMRWINGIAVVGHGYIRTAIHTGVPHFATYVLQNDAGSTLSAADAPESDVSIGLLRANLEFALVHPRHYSHLMRRFLPTQRQMLLPFTDDTSKCVQQSFKPRQPSRSHKKGGRGPSKGVDSTTVTTET